jgi:hypothetical protein
VEGDGGDDGIAAIEEFVKFVRVLGERLAGASQRQHHFTAAMPTAGINVVGRVHVFDAPG